MTGPNGLGDLMRDPDETIRRMTAFQNELGTRQDRAVARDALAELAAEPAAHRDGTAVVFDALRDRLSRQ